MERRGPALGATRDILEDIRIQDPAIGLREEARRFGDIEAKVVRAEFGHLAIGTQPGQRDGRAAPAGDDDRQALGRTRDEFADDESGVLGLVHQVEVVEDEDRPVGRDRRKLADEDVEDGLPRRSADAGLGQHREGRWRETRVVLAPGRDEVMEQRRPVEVVVVQAIPERPESGPTREVREQRRLAVPGVREDQHDPAVDLGVQPVQEPIAGERLVAQRRRLDLGVLDGVAHGVTARSRGTRAADPTRPSRTNGDQRAVE